MVSIHGGCCKWFLYMGVVVNGFLYMGTPVASTYVHTAGCCGGCTLTYAHMDDSCVCVCVCVSCVHMPHVPVCFVLFSPICNINDPHAHTHTHEKGKPAVIIFSYTTCHACTHRCVCDGVYGLRCVVCKQRVHAVDFDNVGGSPCLSQVHRSGNWRTCSCFFSCCILFYLSRESTHSA